jgi:drug/metabolite transporter (DMT)-like permease
VTVLWGSTFVVTKSIVREAPPLVYLTFRFGAAAVVLALVYRRRLALGRRALVDGAVLGLLNSLGLLLQVFGQVYTTASKSAFITSLNTPLVPVIGLFLHATRPTRPQQLAVVLATVGLGLLTWPEGGAHWNRGDLLTVGCSVFYAFTIVEFARRARRHDALVLTFVQLVTAALLFTTLAAAAHALVSSVQLGRLPEALLLEARPLVVTRRLAAECLYMALVCTVVTFAGQTWALGRMTATHAAIIFALEPVFASIMAIGVEGSAEWPGARGATGACLVMIAVLVAEIRLPRRRTVE